MDGRKRILDIYMIYCNVGAMLAYTNIRGFVGPEKPVCHVPYTDEALSLSSLLESNNA